jgi:hypothetical protein
VVGLTYAALFPNSFDRMTNDGTIDANKAYKSGNNDSTSANKALQAFFDSCAASTPCPLANASIPDPNQLIAVGNCYGCYIWGTNRRKSQGQV